MRRPDSGRVRAWFELRDGSDGRDPPGSDIERSGGGAPDWAGRRKELGRRDWAERGEKKKRKGRGRRGIWAGPKEGKRGEREKKMFLK